MQVNKYALFDEDRQIGEFIETKEDILSPVRLSIVLNPDIDLNNFRYWALRAIQVNRVINDKGVRFWIDERCTPVTQDGIKRKLKGWGMSEYDQLTIMHQSMAVNINDALWIRFNPKATFHRNHPRGNNFERILPMVEFKH